MSSATRTAASALEATFLTDRIGKLMLYEPPLHEPVANNLAGATKVEELINKGELEQAFVTFQTEIVKQSPEEIARMRARPTWTGLVAQSPCILARCAPCRRINSTRTE